jgi:hypothetical protein
MLHVYSNSLKDKKPVGNKAPQEKPKDDKSKAGDKNAPGKSADNNRALSVKSDAKTEGKNQANSQADGKSAKNAPAPSNQNQAKSQSGKDSAKPAPTPAQANPKVTPAPA